MIVHGQVTMSFAPNINLDTNRDLVMRRESKVQLKYNLSK